MINLKGFFATLGHGVLKVSKTAGAVGIDAAEAAEPEINALVGPGFAPLVDAGIGALRNVATMAHANVVAANPGAPPNLQQIEAEIDTILTIAGPILAPFFQRFGWDVELPMPEIEALVATTIQEVIDIEAVKAKLVIRQIPKAS